MRRVRGRRLGWIALAVYVALGLALTLVPRNPLNLRGRELPLDVPVNLVMLAPPVAAVLLLRRRLHPLIPVAVASAVSAAIEVVQALTPREASLRDWVLNTAGAAAGAAVAVVLRGGEDRHPGP